MTINVVYLAYLNKEAGYGIEIVEDFLNSYKLHKAGIEHSLIIIAKNWTDNILYKQLCQLAKENNAKIIDLPDDGWDLGAYFRVAKILDSEYILFTASSTKILADNWLLKCYNAFKSNDSIQLVGPMGSWGYRLNVKEFPNPHIRTSTFMIKRDLFLEYVSTQEFPQTKEDTHKMEHGETSITNFVLNKGYKSVVVNSDGEIFTPENWVYSQTYNTPKDNKSLFSDMRSALYYTYDDEKKRNMEMATWGQYLNDSKIKIFLAYQKITPIFMSEVFQPIFNGASNASNRVNALKDNFGINISDKNVSYGELTGHYWVWKNYLEKTQAEYIGFSQHCSFLDFNIHKIASEPFQQSFILDFEKMFKDYTQENIYNCVKNYDVVLPEAFTLGKSLYEDCLAQHSKENIDLALNIIKEIHPNYAESIQEAMSDSKMYSCFVFVMKKEIIREYLDWIFNLLFICEEKTKNEKSFAISSACLAEIFFNIWLTYNIKHKNLNILNTTSIYVPMDFIS